ncbi:MAG: S8 family serine peptidase [Ferruginibacter sp.]
MQRLLLVLFVFIGLELSAQKILSSKKPGSKHATASVHYFSNSISPQTAILLLRQKKNLESKQVGIDSNLIKAYGIINKNSVNYVNAFISVSGSFKVTDIMPYGFVPGTIKNTLITGLIPIDQIEAIANLANINYLSVGEMGAPALDSARKSTKVNLVHQGYQLPQSYMGDGVVIGIIDIGLDYTHPDFFDSTGTANYRIKRVWEQLETSGTTPVNFSYGRELITQTQILNAQHDIAIYSHGTHVAGIAAGAGGGINTKFRGIAPGADIVLVSSDGNTAKLLDGIVYVMDYASSVNKPCVINLSWVSHLGPHDGTSAFDKSCDLLAGPGKIIVGAAGNYGGDSIYLSKTFSGTDTSLFSFIKFPGSSPGTNGTTLIDIWGVPNQDFKVGVSIYNTATNLYEDNTAYYSGSTNATVLDTLFDDIASIAAPHTCNISFSTGIAPLNNKPHVMLTLDNSGQGDIYRYLQIEIIGKNTQTKAWASAGGAIFTALGYGGNVKGGSTNSTVGEIGGTGNNIITVGAYSSLITYTALNGSAEVITTPTAVGDIAAFSSKGPTADGRTKPDITAPGNAVISAVNSFDNVFTTGSNLVAAVVPGNNRDWFFGVSHGTSMAAPMVTGIIALWLQADPTLTPSQVKTYLGDSAITDAFTGIIPASGSNIWGWGKVDAYRGLKKVLSSVVYTFSGNGNWNDPANWTNNIIPPANLMAGTILIDHTAGGKCILNVNQVISTNSNLTIKANRNLLIQGAFRISK